MLRNFHTGGGNCMRGYGIRPGMVMVTDTAAPVCSADIVVVSTPTGYITKQLVTDARGRWFLLCSDGLAAISQYAFVPTEVVKVIGYRQGLPLVGESPELPAHMRASNESVVIYAALAGRVDGFVAGVPFPGVEAVLNAFDADMDSPECSGRFKIARAALADVPEGTPSLDKLRRVVEALGDQAHGQLPPAVPTFTLPDLSRREVAGGVASIAATLFADGALPSTNPTVPTAVTSLGALSRPGAVEWNWSEPAVQPRGMYFRIMQAAVNSYGAAAERWSGNALGKTLTYTNTATLFHWLDSVAAHGSYRTFPGVNSGVPAAALLTDTANIGVDAVTKVYIDTDNSTGPTNADTNALEVSVSEAGTFEVSVNALFSVSTFTSPGELLITLTAPGSSGAFQELFWSSYPVTASGQRIEVILRNTYVTTGGGPWTIRFGFADDGAGNQFTGSALSMRVTVIRR